MQSLSKLCMKKHVYPNDLNSVLQKRKEEKPDRPLFFFILYELLFAKSFLQHSYSPRHGASCYAAVDGGLKSVAGAVNPVQLAGDSF